MKFDPNKLQAQAILGVNHLVYETGINSGELPVGVSQGDCDRLLAEYISIYAKQLTKQSDEMLHALRFATECDPKKEEKISPYRLFRRLISCSRNSTSSAEVQNLEEAIKELGEEELKKVLNMLLSFLLIEYTEKLRAEDERSRRKNLCPRCNGTGQTSW